MASIQRRVSKQGNVSYRAQVRRKGHPPLTVTFDRKTDAQQWAADREADIRQGRHFKYASAKSHTLGEMVGNKGFAKRDLDALKGLVEYFAIGSVRRSRLRSARECRRG